MARGLSRALPVLGALRARGSGPLVQATRLTQETDTVNVNTLPITELDVVRMCARRRSLPGRYGRRIGQGGAGCAKCQEGCGCGREQKSTHDVSLSPSNQTARALMDTAILAARRHPHIVRND